MRHGPRVSARRAGSCPLNKSPLVAWVVAWVEADKILTEADKIRAVEVTSPLPPDECVRRLAQVTTDRKNGWYLPARTATLPDPLFHGTVESSRVRIASFRAVLGRGGSQTAAWFDVRVNPGPDGGTVLAGKVGLYKAPASTVSSLVFLAFLAALPLFFFVLGVVIAASGHFNFGVGAAIVVPVFVVAAFAIAASRGDLNLEDEGQTQPLLRTICGVLGATSVSSD